MATPEKLIPVDDCIKDGPQSAMEKTLLVEFLRKKGYTLKDLDSLPEEQAQELMKQACQHASLQLARMESTAHLKEAIKWPA